MDISVDITIYLQPGTLTEDRAVAYADALQRYMPSAAASFGIVSGEGRAQRGARPRMDRIDTIGQAPDVVSALRSARDALALTLHCAHDDLPILSVIVNVLSGDDDPLAIELEAA